MTEHYKIHFDFPTWKIRWLPPHFINRHYSSVVSSYPLITSITNLDWQNYKVIRKPFESTYFCRGKIFFPNNINKLLCKHRFNYLKVKEISKQIKPLLAIISKFENCGIFTDGFINVAAAAYRGDDHIMVYAPYNVKSAKFLDFYRRDDIIE